MKRSLLYCLVVAVLSLVCPAVRAEGWKMPRLNPFKKRDSHPAHLRIADDEGKSSWWKPKVPSLPSMSSRKSAAKPAKPSTWSKVSGGTKTAWTKTKDVLNPFDDKQDKPKSVTGYGSPFSQASTRKKAEGKSSWWPSWGGEPEKKSRTVQDFIGQPMPDF